MKKLYRFIFGILFFSLLLLSEKSFCQGEKNKWYFGRNAAIDFNPGSPVAIKGSSMVTTSGCASIADAAGNLLFYTNGDRVWSKNNLQMPTGFALWGSDTAAQSSLIVKDPGNSNKYYLFTAPAQVGGAGAGGAYPGIAYSVVDMTLNGGERRCCIRHKKYSTA